MKYKIAICDDSDADREYVLKMVNHWAAEAGHQVNINTFVSAENFLFHYTEECDYDILLLDIEMGAMDGVTMAKQLRKNNDTIQIIFITGYSDYISEGYEVAALHYLMKPVKEEKLTLVLERATQKISKNEKIINFEAGGEMIRDLTPGTSKGSFTPFLQLKKFPTHPSPLERKHEGPAHIQGSPVSASELEMRDPFPVS